MAPKGEDGSWLRNGTEERKSLDSISVRIEAQDAFKRQQNGGAGGVESDGEGDEYNGCFPRGLGPNVSRKVYSDSTNMKGAPFARLDAQGDAESVKSKLLGAIYCCCGPSGQAGAIDLKSIGDSKQESDTSSRWEDLDLSECCKPPYWRQLARRAKAHVHVRQPQPTRSEWLNYDPHSYQMNFDDGCRQECDSSLHIDECDDSVSRERAMQSALLKKFAASRAQRVV